MGLALPKPCLSKVVERSGSDFYGAACVSVNGYRISMEDDHMLSTNANGNTAYFGVFDGHNGDGCSTWLANNLPQKLRALPDEGLDRGGMENFCEAADSEFLKLSAPEGGSGSTCVFCSLFKNGRLQICNVGDSRALHCRAGKLLFVTTDHKPSNREEEKRVNFSGGSVRNGRIDGDLAVSRAFGDEDFKRETKLNYREQKVIAIPDVTEHQWSAGDLLILACDGVFEGNFSDQEVCQFVYEQLSKCWNDLAVVASRVCDEAIRRGSKDNISCMVVRLNDGTKEVEQFGKSDFVPGPPFLRNCEESRVSYKKMALLGGKSLAEALEKRYELLQAKEKNILASKNPIMRVAFEMSDEIELQAEKSFFGRGPAPGNAKAYFEVLSNAQ